MNVLESGLPVVICAYKAGSASAKALCDYLKTKGVKSSIRARDPVRVQSVIFNWGQSTVPVPDNCRVFNHRGNIGLAANKRYTFENLDGSARIPEFTPDSEVATKWLTEDGCTVVARHVLTGHSGRGIQIVSSTGNVYRDPAMPDDTPWWNARLFTKYVKKAQEFRVFIVGQSAVFAYRKGLATDVAEENRQFFVRTHATGWNFCDIDLSQVPPDVINQSVQAVRALGLDYAAVDIGWNAHREEATVFEVNTAPGIQGTSVQRFGDALLQLDVAPAPAVPQQPPADTNPTIGGLVLARAILDDYHRAHVRRTRTAQGIQPMPVQVAVQQVIQ